MNWKPLLAFPLAGLICGQPVDPPRLKSALPKLAGCKNAEEAERKYLLAFAYRADDPEKSAQLERAFLEILRNCAASKGEISRFSLTH